MSKIAVVYWSGTGNTEKMAEAVVKGAKEKGADVHLYKAMDFSASMVSQFDAVCWGCPAMGVEQLEEETMRPLWNACKTQIKGRKVAFFGSYGSGGGPWMTSWEQEAEEAGAKFGSLSVICEGAPDEHALRECEILGGSVAK